MRARHVTFDSHRAADHRNRENHAGVPGGFMEKMAMAANQERTKERKRGMDGRDAGLQRWIAGADSGLPMYCGSTTIATLTMDG